jgi:CRISPR type III-A/MTUBE-associated protein Csm6
MKVLLSGLGKSDPMTEFSEDNVYDGSCLHLIRHYLPDKVYLLYSKEMCDLEDEDNRFEKTLDLFNQKYNKSIQVKKYLKRDLIDVYKFDIFFDIFENIIDDIIEENGEDTEIYLNVSSGTPGMKSALQTIAVTSPYNLTPLQVTDPTKGKKKREVNSKAYDTDLYWSCNVDNNQDSINRSSESNYNNLKFRVQKKTIESFIEKSNYDAAYDLALLYKDHFNKEVFELLKFAKCRSHFELSNAKKIDNKYQFNLIPYKNGGDILFEYSLWLNYKFSKSDYSDFIRAINPFMYESFNDILVKKFNVDLMDYCDRNGKLICEDLKTNNLEIYNILNSKFKNGIKDDVRISELHMLFIIREKESDEKLIDAVNQINELREKIRNVINHKIVDRSLEDIESILGNKLDFYIKQIKYILKYLGYNLQNWDSYEKMNSYILKKLDAIVDKEN